VIQTIMATTINKQRLLAHLFNGLKKVQGAGEPVERPVLEQFLYAICREGVTREQADEAFRRLRERFFDWNEVRVSSVRELEEALSDLPEPEVRAQRLVSFLQEVFETTFSFDLEPLQKKGMKQAAKQLSRYQAANDYAVSLVVQQSLGGHAIPLDVPTLRVLQRLGLIEEDQNDPEAVRASLEHLIPKSRDTHFSDLISYIADKYCWEDSPDCAHCPLASECATGRTAAHEPVATGRASRVKPR
jgi:endonuclease-3